MLKILKPSRTLVIEWSRIPIGFKLYKISHGILSWKKETNVSRHDSAVMVRGITEGGTQLGPP